MSSLFFFSLFFSYRFLAREYDLQLQEKASRKELAEKRQRECKETILKLTKSEHKLCDLILKGSGEDPFCLRNDPVPSTKRLRTVILDDLVAYSQKISYSTAAPPVTPPTAIVYMPHSLAMRCSTLYYPVPGLSDPNHPFMEELRQQQLLQQQQQQEQERLRQQQHQQKIKQEDIAVELDLDLGDGEDSSLDSDSSSDEGDDEDDDKMDEWDIE